VKIVEARNVVNSMVVDNWIRTSRASTTLRTEARQKNTSGDRRPE
jgi:hypothetical protein